MKKNLNAVITNSILIALSVLFFCFMAGSYILNLSGYNMLSVSLEIGFHFTSSTGMAFALFSIGSLIVLIGLGVVAVLAVLNLLVALNVIKNEGLAKVFGKIILTLAGVALGGFIMSFVGYYLLTEAESLGWALILNTILVIAIVIVAFYNKVASKIAARKAAKENKQ